MNIKTGHYHQTIGHVGMFGFIGSEIGMDRVSNYPDIRLPDTQPWRYVRSDIQPNIRLNNGYLVNIQTSIWLVRISGYRILGLGFRSDIQPNIRPNNGYLVNIQIQILGLGFRSDIQPNIRQNNGYLVNIQTSIRPVRILNLIPLQTIDKKKTRNPVLS